MRVRNSLWALLLSLPVALFVLNCGPANPSDEAAPTTQLAKGDIQQAADLDVNAKVASDNSNLTLDEGSADEWRGWGRGWGRCYGRGWGGGWGRGWGGGWGRGWGGWGGWGSWGGWSYPYYSWAYPYYSWAYPYYSGWWY